MKRRFLLLAVAFPWPMLAQVPRDSVVSVSASRITRIAPDRASLYLIVEGTAETAADAITRAEAKLKAVTDALKAYGPRANLDLPVSYGVGPTPNLTGYPGQASPPTNLARFVVRVQVDRLEQLASIVAGAIGAGAATSSSLTFESSVADSVRRSRIGEAIGAARLDAEAVAASLGVRLGSLVSVSTTGGPFAFQGPSSLNFDGRFTQPTQVPDVQITTGVTVQFRLRP
jgi:uncharacterized protein YggE